MRVAREAVVAEGASLELPSTNHSTTAPAIATKPTLPMISASVREVVADLSCDAAESTSGWRCGSPGGSEKSFVSAVWRWSSSETACTSSTVAVTTSAMPVPMMIHGHAVR